MSVRLSECILPAFADVWRDVKTHGHTHYWLHGGRGSTKSSFISLAIVLLVVMFPFANACIVRRFSNTLRDSVYQQMLWAIDTLGLSDYFKASVSPMEIIYLPTGQRIVFRGMDDPLKLKGVKFTKGYCAVVWLEEEDQMASWEVVRSALNSLRRGGEKFWIFHSYNPPRTKWCWINRQRLEMERRPDALVHHSTYLDVTATHPEWLGAPFVEEAEWVKESNPDAYRWEFLGEITGTGGSVFENVVERRITDEEIRTFDRPRLGIDWGWFPDPWRFVQCEWQPGERRLLVYGEESRNRTLPQDTAKLVRARLTYPDREGGEPRYHDEPVWCDDTPDGKVQMRTYRDEGVKARPARKGGMRTLSYQWLAGLREIVIDPRRCPHAYEEFMLKEYGKDKDGEWIDEIPDGQDHSIDAVRYAMMNEVLRGR